MNKSAIKTTVYIFKYLASVFLVLLIVLSTDVLTANLSGGAKELASTVSTLLHSKISITSWILLVCLFVIVICNFILHFFKAAAYDEELKKLENESLYKINSNKNKYDKINRDVQAVELKLSEEKKYLHNSVNNKVVKLLNHYAITEAHFERRKANYFTSNQNLYKIVKTSRNIDKETVLLIKDFEEEINR